MLSLESVPFMGIEDIPDWERRLDRQDAFWQRQLIDRPVVIFTLPRPEPRRPWPTPRPWPTLRDRWWDAEWLVECALAHTGNTEYWGDALPQAWPNLGPEVFACFFGAEMEYGESTSWSIPFLKTWADVAKLQFREDNRYWRKLTEITDALLAAGRGRFYVGMTDMHPGGDALAAWRDPLQLNFDMIEAQAEVRKLLAWTNEQFAWVFDHWHGKLRAAGQACCSWPGPVSRLKWAVPSNDFSCMISRRMFDDIFLPGIAEECRRVEASVYHLDGPGALQHLDSLLSIPELSAIQWVYGEGHGPASNWLPVYKKCQAAGKGLQIGLGLDELDLFMAELHPEGLWLSLSGVRDREQAQAVLRRVEGWR